jgi:hypothetical protein
MAKRSTPIFLKGIKASIDAAKSGGAQPSDTPSTRAKSAKKKSDKKRAKEKERVKRRKVEQQAKRAASIKIPNYVGNVGFESQQWKTAAEYDNLLHNPWGNGNDFTFGDALKKARGLVQCNWTGTKSDREDWAKEKDPKQFRDRLFSAIPEGKIKDYEREYLLKWGDYRKLGWSDWCTTLWDMYKPRSFNPDLEIWELAREFVINELLTSRGVFTQEMVQPLGDVSEAFDSVTTNKNSGMPYCTSKWNEDNWVRQFYIDIAEYMLEGNAPHNWFVEYHDMDVESAKVLTAAILFTRRQSNGGIDDELLPTRPDGKPSVKMRAVECPIKSDAIAGKVFIDPLLDRMREIPSYSGFAGADNIGRYVYGLLDSYPNSLEADFSQFDAGVQREMMREVLINVVSKVFGEEHLPYFEMIAEWYTTMYVLNPNGYTTNDHGLLSGCAWTSVIGTLSNRLCTVYTLLKMGIDATNPSEVEHLAFGDDIAIFSNVTIDTSDLESIMGECGMICNKAKQHQSQGDERFVTFLGYRHFIDIPPDQNFMVDYIGVFPIMRTQLFFRERFTQDLEGVCASMGITPEVYDIMRYICKLENLRNHPNRMAALESMIQSGVPLQHVLYDGPVPDSLRVGRRSRGVNFSDHWIQQVTAADPAN